MSDVSVPRHEDTPQGEPHTNPQKRNPILIRKSRLWGVEIALHDNWLVPDGWYFGERWLLECRDHGFVEEYATKREALAAMSHSDDWCIMCIDNANPLYGTNRWNKAAQRTEGGAE